MPGACRTGPCHHPHHGGAWELDRLIGFYLIRTTHMPARRPRPAFLRHALVAVGVVCAALGNGSAMASSVDEVRQLLGTGQTGKALRAAERYLATNAQDPAMRLLKGFLLAESGRLSEAISTFVALTVDHPELPEPYNNLAVLYARQRQFDKARETLELALRTHPSYAIVHDNLGDINAQLSSQAYLRALQLTHQTSARDWPKLHMIPTLSVALATPAPPPAASPSERPAPVVAAATSPATSEAQAIAPVAARPAAQVASEPANAPRTDGPVLAATQAWARAWAAQDMAAYLAAYSPDFRPSPAMSRADWEAQRKARIVSKSRIDVQLSDIRIRMEGDRASVSFHQRYQADGLLLRNRKTLHMTRDGDRWLIVRETTGS